MPDPKSDLKRIPHRSWTDIRDVWLTHIPDIHFDEEFPAPTLWDILGTERIETPTTAIGEIAYIEGVRESVFREVVILARKFTYCRKVAICSTADGHPTWSVIAAYDACFFGAKAICYLLGFVSVSRSSRLYMDILSPRIEKKKGRSIAHYDVIFLHLFKERLTHEYLWGITARLIRTVSLPDSHEDLLRRLRSLEFEDISSLRNRLIYSGGFWLGKDVIDNCDLIREFSSFRVLRAQRFVDDACENDDRYFQIIHLFGEIITFLFSDIADLRPGMRVEVLALSNWDLK